MTFFHHVSNSVNFFFGQICKYVDSHSFLWISQFSGAFSLRASNNFLHLFPGVIFQHQLLGHLFLLARPRLLLSVKALPDGRNKLVEMLLPLSHQSLSNKFGAQCCRNGAELDGRHNLDADQPNGAQIILRQQILLKTL